MKYAWLAFLAIVILFAAAPQYRTLAATLNFCQPSCATSSPTPTPTPGPIGLSPSSLSLGATAAPTTVAVTDPHHIGGFTVSPSPAGIVLASITGTGTSATITVAVQGPGTTQIHVGDGNSTVLLPVGVATPAPPVPTPTVGATNSAAAVFPTQSPTPNDASAPHIRQVCSYAAADSSGGAAVACPSGAPPSGDLLYAGICANTIGDNNRIVVAPSGWQSPSPIGSVTSPNLNQPTLFTFLKIAGASEPTSYLFYESAPSNTFVPISGIIYDLYNMDPTTYLGPNTLGYNYVNTFYTNNSTPRALVAHNLLLWTICANGGSGVYSGGQFITPAAPAYGFYLDAFAYAYGDSTLGVYEVNPATTFNPYSYFLIPSTQSYATAMTDIQPIGAPATPTPIPSATPTGTPGPSVTASPTYDNFSSYTPGSLPTTYAAVAYPSPSSTPPWVISNVGGTNYLTENSSGAASDLLYANTAQPFNSLYETYSFTYTGPTSVVSPAFITYPAAPPFGYYSINISAGNTGTANTAVGKVVNYCCNPPATYPKGSALATRPYNYTTGHTYRVDAYVNPASGKASVRVYDVATGPLTFDQQNGAVSSSSVFYPGLVNQNGGAVAVTDFGYGPAAGPTPTPQPAATGTPIAYSGPPIAVPPVMPQIARRAWDYFNYIGMNWLSTSATPSTDLETLALLQYAPLMYLMHVRLDVGPTYYATFNYAQADIAALGIPNYYIDATCLTNATTTTSQLNTFIGEMSNGCAAVEMVNEPSGFPTPTPNPTFTPTTPPALAAIPAQAQAFASNNANSASGSPSPVPSTVWGPSVLVDGRGGPLNTQYLFSPSPVPAIPPSLPLSSTISAWNTHSYMGQWQPENPYGFGGLISGCGVNFAEICGPYGSYSFWVNMSSTIAPTLPGMSTEGVASYGSYPAICGISDISLNSQQAYVTRALPYWFKVGLLRAFPYKLLDDGEACMNGFNTFGLANRINNYDGTTASFNPKPSLTALMYMQQILWDHGSTASTFTPSPLSFAIAGPPDIEQLLLEHADGSYYIIVWSDNQMWNTGASPMTENPTIAEPVTINLGAASKATVYTQTLGSGTWSVATPLSSVTAVPITVTYQPQIVQIIPSGSSATPAPIATGIPTPGPTQTPPAGIGYTPPPIVATPTPLAAATVASDNFDSDTVGTVPSGWILGATAPVLEPWGVSTFQPITSPHAFGESGTPNTTDLADYIGTGYANQVEEEVDFQPVSVGGTLTVPVDLTLFSRYFAAGNPGNRSTGLLYAQYLTIGPNGQVNSYTWKNTFLSIVANISMPSYTLTAGHSYGFKLLYNGTGSNTTWTAKIWDLAGSEPAYPTPATNTGYISYYTCGLKSNVAQQWSIDDYACAYNGATLPALP